MDVGAKLSKGRPKCRCLKTVDFGDFGVNARLRVVPHFSSRIVERAKREWA